MGMRIEEASEREVCEKAAVRGWIKDHWDSQRESLNYPDGIFKVDQEGDWDLLYVMLGKVIPKLYEKNLCDVCQVTRDQRHIINECTKHNEQRNNLRRNLQAIGINMRADQDVDGWVHRIQICEDIRSLKESKREEVIQEVARFVKEVRASYLGQ